MIIAESAEDTTKSDDESRIVKSPIVGTFYDKASPEKDTFVKVGEKVSKGDTLCIIEAMKIMNEINSDFDGEVVEILCNNDCLLYTSGLVAATLVNYPGVSEVFMQGVVSYSNEAKIQRLGVKKETVDKLGAVSKEVAMEMAEGVANTAGTNIGVSSTGIAGPGGGSEEKPVGLVYIGFYIDGDVSYKELNFSGNREAVRHKAVLEILNELRLKLRKY